jgi:PAS domain S-box-containing protein
MEQLSARILERSSDAIVIIRLADRTVVGANEAFFAVTGYPQHELVRRHVYDVLVQLESVDGLETIDALEELGALSRAPTGLWTRTGELRYGYLSALVVDADGQRDAVCTIRDIRDPSPGERRLAARARFTRIVEAGGPRLEVTSRAIQALGESLRWEFGALWLMTPETLALRCAVVWRSPLSGLKALEEATWRTASPPGVGLVGRRWQHRQAAWVPDAVTEPEPDPRLLPEEAGELVHGWFGFPVWVGGDVIGVVELFSPEVRQPDEELLQMTEVFGRLIGRLLEDAEGRAEPSDGTLAARARPQGAEERPQTVSSALRDLGEAVATVAGKLDRLLEGAVEPGQRDRPERQPRALAGPAIAQPLPRIPTGLTLKAVSRRTGIPAATLRTWERRYGFVRPVRSASGYRLYGEEEIARVLQVKYLMEQGVRIGEAMAMVRGNLHRPQATG